MSAIMETKTCRICGQAKSLYEFHRRTKAKDGRHTACKPCAIAEQNRSRLKPRPVLPEKACTMCGKTKPLEDFVRNRNYFDGHNHICKACLYAQRKTYGESRENKDKLNEAQKRRYWADQERALDRHLTMRLRVPAGTYAKLLKLQGGRCAICGRTENCGKRRFAVDHCHDTGAVRGLLCTPCNQAIGQLQDLPELLRKAADYIETHRTQI